MHISTGTQLSRRKYGIDFFFSSRPPPTPSYGSHSTTRPSVSGAKGGDGWRLGLRYYSGVRIRCGCVCVSVFGLGIFMYAKRRNSVYYGPAGKLYILSPLLAAFLPPPPHPTRPALHFPASLLLVVYGVAVYYHRTQSMRWKTRDERMGKAFFDVHFTTRKF